MITIKKAPTAECDYSTVTKAQLSAASAMHIRDVCEGLAFFRLMLQEAAKRHDSDKITGLAEFHADFRTCFKQTGWYDRHRKISRHHIDKPDGVRDNVNLIDVLEHIVDCVMAGMARSGSVYDLELPDELLQKALRNTVELLKANVEVGK